MGHRPMSGHHRAAQRITNNPSGADEKDCIIKLIGKVGKVVTVSLETQKLVEELPELTLSEKRHRFKKGVA